MTSDVYLLDTNIACCLWDDQNAKSIIARDFLTSLGRDATAIVSVVSLAEIEYGLKISPAIDPSRHSLVRNAMSSFPLVQEITKHTAEYYSTIRAELFKLYSTSNNRGCLTSKRVEDLIDRTTSKELGIQENDLWIAAQAMEWDAVLVTNDSMKRIASLQLNGQLRLTKWC